MIPHLETDARKDKKDSRPLLHQKRRHRLTRRCPKKVQAAEERAFPEQEERFCADISFGESVRIRHVILGTLPCVNPDANMATYVNSDILRLMCSLARSRRKVVWKVQLPYWRSLYKRKSTPREEGQLGSNHAVIFSIGTWHNVNMRERKGPSRGVIQKCVPHERNPCAPRFEERTQDETLHQERCARRVACDLAKSVQMLQKIRTELRFTLLLMPGQRWRPLQNLLRNGNSWLIPEHQRTCWAKRIRAQPKWRLCGDKSKVNSLSDAREFYDPESGSSSGATHVPDRTSTIPSPRTLPRCDSGLPRDTQNGTGNTGNVFERPPAQEGLSSTIFNNSKDLASSSQDWDLILSKRQVKEVVKWKENRWIRRLNHLTSKVEMVCWIILVEFIHTVVWWIFREFFLRNGILEIFLTLWNFKAGKSTDPQITMLWIKEVEIANQLTNSWHRDRLQGYMIFLTTIWLMQWLCLPCRSLSTRSQIFEKV